MKAIELQVMKKDDIERTRCIAMLSRVLDCDYREAENKLMEMEKQYVDPDEIQEMHQDKLELKEKVRKLIMDKAEEIYRNQNCSMNEAIEKARKIIIESLEEKMNE